MRSAATRHRGALSRSPRPDLDGRRRSPAARRSGHARAVRVKSVSPRFTCCPGAVASSTTALHSPRCSASAARAPTHVLQPGPAAQASPLPLGGCRGRCRTAINRTRRPIPGPSEPNLWPFPNQPSLDADAGQNQQPWRGGGDQWGEFGVKLASLPVEPLVAAGQQAQRGLGGLHRVSEIGSVAQPGAGGAAGAGARPSPLHRWAARAGRADKTVTGSLAQAPDLLDRRRPLGLQPVACLECRVGCLAVLLPPSGWLADSLPRPPGTRRGVVQQRRDIS